MNVSSISAIIISACLSRERESVSVSYESVVQKISFSRRPLRRDSTHLRIERLFQVVAFVFFFFFPRPFSPGITRRLHFSYLRTRSDFTFLFTALLQLPKLRSSRQRSAIELVAELLSLSLAFLSRITRDWNAIVGSFGIMIKARRLSRSLRRSE